MSFAHKNPEYTIDGQLGDRKGIMGEKGVTAGFKAAKKQGCKLMVHFFIHLLRHVTLHATKLLQTFISCSKMNQGTGT